MDRRRSLLKIAALRSDRERQEGVNTAEGGFITSALELKAAPCSIQCVFIPRSIANEQVIFSTSSGSASPHIELHTDGALWLYTASRYFVVSNVVLGTAYDVVFSLDDNRQSIYLNGELLVSYDAAPTPFVDYALGLQNAINLKRFDGDYLFHRHFNYAMDADEVKTLYNDGDPAGYILPQNLKNIKDMAFTSKTLEFDMDSPYYQLVLESGELESGRKYRVDYVVEEWDIAPAVMGTCGISCGVLSTVGTQYWPNLSAAKLGENQYVVVDTKETGTPYMFVYASNPSYTYTSRRLKVTVHSVKMLGCVAEYLPQNLVGQWHEKPFEITGITTYTWTGETDPVYYRELLLSIFIQTGAVVMIKGSVSDYQSGEPFVYVGNRQVMIPAQNGSFTLKVINNRDNIDRIYYYGGTHLSDRRLTITIDSVELIPDVALSWLDSARKLPLNDEYLPPLLQSDGGYDLTANGTPQIIIK